MIWEHASGHWDLLQYKPSPPFQNIELFSGGHEEGTWEKIRTGHRLINLGLAPFEGDKPRVLDWEEQSGHFRILPFNDTAIGTDEDALLDPKIEGTWKEIRTGHKLVYLGGTKYWIGSPLPVTIEYGITIVDDDESRVFHIGSRSPS